MSVGCTTQADTPDSLVLSITAAELPDGLRVDTIHFRARFNDQLFPEAGDSVQGRFGLSAASNPSESPVYLAVESNGVRFPEGPARTEIVGLSNGVVVAFWSGKVELQEKNILAVHLTLIGDLCDVDADTFMDCSVAGCCGDDTANDCEPTEASAHPWGVEASCEPCDDTIDQDCLGGDNPCIDDDGDGVADCAEVAAGCGIGNALAAPGLPEVCDGQDNDCDGVPDNGFAGPNGEPKGAACGLGFCSGGVFECPNGAANVLACSTDNLASESEFCGDDIDNDCNGLVDEGCSGQDLDGDGFDAGADCNDYDAAFNPNALEGCCILADGETLENPAVQTRCDRNCDGEVQPCPPGDSDGDGVSLPADCDDTEPSVYPGAIEKCGDSIDQDCFGGDLACSLIIDTDGDGYADSSDCLPEDPKSYPWAPEVCDGQDNNCDGVVDDGNPGGTPVCGSGIGQCATGEGVCVKSSDGTSLVCLNEIAPSPEVCDDLDNDCNGLTDDGLLYEGALVGGACDGVGACGLGVVECRPDGAVTCSTNPAGSSSQNTPEVCDALDNNCDGDVNEDLTIASSECFSAGVCEGNEASIVATCSLNGLWTCDYSAVPGYEGLVELTCDGIDNDCDGFVDEDFGVGLGCSTDGDDTCADGRIACAAAGAFDVVTCVLAAVPAEVCDGLDNDCDGETDEGFDFTTACDGPDGDECKNGVPVCAPNGVGTICGVEAISDIAEICNDIDDNCDGVVDETFPSKGGDCDGDDSDLCTNGTYTCALDGLSIECINETDSYVEQCNGLDDDCDGLVDEDAGPTLGRPCDGDDSDTCLEGTWECPSTGANTPLVCSDDSDNSVELCNGLDDDCDGLVDENIVGSAVDGGCNTDGICAEFVAMIDATCSTDGAALWQCNYQAVDNFVPVEEGQADSCDGADNDCDGTVDEGYPDMDVDGQADCVDLDIDGDSFTHGIDGQVSAPCSGGSTSGGCEDNCAFISNPQQLDMNDDGEGDACDSDIDGDDVPNDELLPPCNASVVGCSDNCPTIENPDQADADGDGIGDACAVTCPALSYLCADDGRTRQRCNATGNGLESNELCEFVCVAGSCRQPTGVDAGSTLAGCDDTAPALVFLAGLVIIQEDKLLYCASGDCDDGAESIAANQVSDNAETPVIFCGSELVIGEGATMTHLPASNPPPGPVVFVVNGNAIVAGSIAFEGGSASAGQGGPGGPGGADGGDQPSDSQDGFIGEGIGGGLGGVGGTSAGSNFDATGGGGGGFGGLGGSGGGSGNGVGGDGGDPYWNTSLGPLIGGSGGGAGGDGNEGLDGKPGGGGGGAIQIVARGEISVPASGSLSARGGDAGAAATGRHGGGGGGSGGAILLEAPVVSLSPDTLDVRGGNGGAATDVQGGLGATNGVDGSPGESDTGNYGGGGGGGGSAGRIRVNSSTNDVSACVGAVPVAACSHGLLHGFGPAGVGSIAGWVDASRIDGNSPGANNASVTDWFDLSFSGRSLASLNDAPPQSKMDSQGRHYVEFDSSFLTMADSVSLDTFPGWTVALVARTREVSPGFAVSTTIVCSNSRFSAHIPWANGLAYVDSGGCNPGNRISANWDGSIETVYVWLFGGSASTSKFLERSTDTLVEAGGIGNYHYSDAPFSVGARDAQGNGAQQMDVYELVFYDRVLSAAERQALTSELMTKWGL